MKKLIAIMMLFVLSFGLFACAEEEFVSPTPQWCTSMRNLIARADGDTFAGDVESLKLFSDMAKPEIEAYDGVAGEFLTYAMQLPDLMQEYDSFFEMPHYLQQAVLEAWYIMTNANHASSKEEYSETIEAFAQLWLDVYIIGTGGPTLPF